MCHLAAVTQRILTLTVAVRPSSEVTSHPIFRMSLAVPWPPVLLADVELAGVLLCVCSLRSAQHLVHG